MNPVAITAKGISKAYRVYHRGSNRLLDFFRLGMGQRLYDEEFWALRDVSFDIRKGTTVGIIGRNGAGKSTLLRILAGMAAPTAGEVAVHGEISTLLELGSGFHPDLTGRENIYAGGVYLGKTKEEIDRLYSEIVAFSELDAFIDQPVKNYSHGMYMRLAFALATAFNPDVLIIDEVLAVGDAYFVRKCSDRIQSFVSEGRTILIVSHDLAAVQRLCSRLLWIDKGRLVMDGPTIEVLRAYAAAIREQEQGRLRQKHVAGTDARQTLREKGLVYGSGEIIITDVRFLNRQGGEQWIFAVGEPFVIRIHYRAQAPVQDPVFAVSVYRLDGVTAVQAISSLDAVRFGALVGEGHVDVVFDPPVLGAARYVVSIAILPKFDPADRIEQMPYDRHSRLYEFSIEADVTCPVDLGLVRQRVSWEYVAGGRGTGGGSGEDHG